MGQPIPAVSQSLRHALNNVPLNAHVSSALVVLLVGLKENPRLSGTILPSLPRKPRDFPPSHGVFWCLR